MPSRQPIVIFSPVPPEGGFGVGQRYQAIAETLAANGYEVKVATRSLREKRDLWARSSFSFWVGTARRAKYFILSPAVPVRALLLLLFLRKTIITDYYGPDFVEYYEKFRTDGPVVNWLRYGIIRAKLLLLLSVSNLILTATARVEDFLLGIAFERGLLPRRSYLGDRGLKASFLRVPYGCKPVDLTKREEIVRKYLPGVDWTCPVFVWGGGVWGWFDPGIVIRAFCRLNAEGRVAQLLMPDLARSLLPEFDGHSKLPSGAQELKDMGGLLLLKTWAPWDDYACILSLCRAGLSISSDSIENYLSYRTRVVSYIGAGIPVITNTGDCLEQFVRDRGIGLTVESGDEDGLLQALRRMVSDSGFWNQCKANTEKSKAEFQWDNVLQPLVKVLQDEKIQMGRRNRRLSIPVWTVRYFLLRMLYWVTTPIRTLRGLEKFR